MRYKNFEVKIGKRFFFPTSNTVKNWINGASNARNRRLEIVAVKIEVENLVVVRDADDVAFVYGLVRAELHHVVEVDAAVAAQYPRLGVRAQWNLVQIDFA